MTEAELSKAFEILPGRVWYVVVRAIPHPRHDITWVDAETPYQYWPFFEDHGPVSLGPHGHKKANAVYLLASYLLLYHGRTPEEALRPFARLKPAIGPWHDATPGLDDFHLTSLDVLRGIAKARECGFFRPFDSFDSAEYEHYEKVENGDLNWIVDGRFLAFAGPQDARTRTPEGYVTTAVDDLLPYFKRKGVAAVVRLNKKYYNEKRFVAVGIAHHDMYYLDGSNPPEHILQRFLAVCEGTPGGIAVHCKAGLGRTGTCIGAYLMKHYRCTAREVIGWMRVCRPGSVIGPQQAFMESIQARMWDEGEAFRRVPRALPLPVGGSLLEAKQLAAAAKRDPTTPVHPSASRGHGEDSSLRLGGLSLATPSSGSSASMTVSGGASTPPGPASASPMAKPVTAGRGSTTPNSTGGSPASASGAASVPPRVNGASAHVSSPGGAAGSPAAPSRGTGSTLRSPSRLLQLFGSGSGASNSAVDRAYGVPSSVALGGASGPSADSGRRGGAGVPSGFSAFLSSITARSSGSTPRGGAATVETGHSARGDAKRGVGGDSVGAPPSPSSASTVADSVGFGASTHSHSSSLSTASSAASGLSMNALSPTAAGGPVTPVHAGTRSRTGSASSASGGNGYASPGSSPAAAGYLTRSRARVGEGTSSVAAASSSRAAAAGQSTPSRAHSSGSFSSSGAGGGALSTPPRVSGGAGSGGGYSTPAHVPVASQGDLLRSAKSASRSPHVGVGALSPSISLRSAGASLLSPSSSSGAAAASASAGAGGVGQPPRNPNFHVYGSGSAGTSGAATPGSSSLASRSLSRYR